MILNYRTYCQYREAELNISTSSPKYQQRPTKNPNHIISNLGTLSKHTEIKRYAITPMRTHYLVLTIPVITSPLRKYLDCNNSEPHREQRRMV
jgi:hypothetical protein